MENAHQVIWATLYSINSIHITVVCSAYMVGARMKKKKNNGGSDACVKLRACKEYDSCTLYLKFFLDTPRGCEPDEFSFTF